MPAGQRKAPDDQIELPEPSALDRLPATEPAGAPVTDRPASYPLPKQSSIVTQLANSISTQLGWRAFKSAIGLAILVIAGVGPVQRLLELSSVEAVVNARLVSL